MINKLWFILIIQKYHFSFGGCPSLNYFISFILYTIIVLYYFLATLIIYLNSISG